jgi:hypothetical protein
MRGTWRFLPSRMVTQIRLSGMDWLTRIGLAIGKRHIRRFEGVQFIPDTDGFSKQRKRLGGAAKCN